jgi:hypothetical protein
VIIFHGAEIGQQGDKLVGDNIVTEDGEVDSEEDVLEGFKNLDNVSDDAS